MLKHPYRLKYVALLLALICWGLLPAQQQERLTPRFTFSGGIYLSLESVRQNRPDLKWDEVEATLATNPEKGLARLAELRRKAGGEKLPPETVYALGADSLLYVRIEADSLEEEVQLFGGLLIQGKCSLFRFEKEETRMVTISAYNPLTGKPFRSGRVPRKETVEVWMLYNPSSGAVAEMTRSNVLEWIADDPELLRQVQTMPTQDIDWGRVLQTYNRRNPVYVGASGE